MTCIKQFGYAAMLGATLTLVPFTGGTPAEAKPNILNNSSVAAEKNDIVKVRREGRRWRGRHGRDWRRKHWRRHRHHYDNDWNPGAFIALGVLGALLNQGYSEAHARSAMERCDDRFRSFEWDTGLYTTYGGEKRLCPYLR